MTAPLIRIPRFGPKLDPQVALSALGNSVQDLINGVFSTQKLVDGVLVTGAKLVFDSSGNPADTPVTHGLGRKANGYVLCGLVAPFQLWTSASDNPQPTSQLLLSHNATPTAFTSAPGAFALWVF